MNSAADNLNPLKSLALNPQTEILRKVSMPEYYQAAIGTSAHTLERPRISTMVLEGTNNVAPARWDEALRRVANVNPGMRMRMEGRRQRARWSTTGAPYPHLRFVENCVWDGRSHEGMEFVETTALPLETGPVVELIVTSGKSQLIILRAHHAVMDGMGMLHFFRELFRALRGEPLLGSNANFSDSELMRAVTQTPASGLPKGVALPLTGGAQGAEIGGVWRRLTLPLTPQQNLMGRIAETTARYARSFGDGLVRFAVPVSLRRHLPGLLSTLNFTGLLHIDLAANENAEDFRRKLRAALDEKKDAAYSPALEWVRYVPFSWLDFITGRRLKNYLQPYLVETVLITNFGVIDLAEFVCADFVPENIYSMPLDGNSFISLYASGPHLNIMVGMPKVYAAGGRLEQLMEILERVTTSPA